MRLEEFLFQKTHKIVQSTPGVNVVKSYMAHRI